MGQKAVRLRMGAISRADGLLVRLRREHRDPELVGEVAWQLLTRPDPNGPYTVHSFGAPDSESDYSFLVDK